MPDDTYYLASDEPIQTDAAASALLQVSGSSPTEQEGTPMFEQDKLFLKSAMQTQPAGEGLGKKDWT